MSLIPHPAFSKKSVTLLSQRLGLEAKPERKKRTVDLEKRSQEKLVMRAISDYLRLRGYFYYRSSNIPSPISKKNHLGQWVHAGFRQTPVPGLPDFVCVAQGRYYGIEAKDKGKQSEDQKNFQLALEKAGGVYILANSIDNLIAAGL